MLNSPTCPYCGSELPVAETWRRAIRVKVLVLAYRTGLICPGCGQDIVITQRFAVAAGLFLLFAGAIAMAELEKYIAEIRGTPFSKASHLAYLVLAIGVLVWLIERIAPLFLGVRKAEPLEDVSFPE